MHKFIFVSYPDWEDLMVMIKKERKLDLNIISSIIHSKDDIGSWTPICEHTSSWINCIENCFIWNTSDFTSSCRPFPEKGSKTIPSIYRPISLISVIGKATNKLIHERHYSFCYEWSTTGLLSSATQSWSTSLEVEVIPLEISEALHKLWHADLHHICSNATLTGTYI